MDCLPYNGWEKAYGERPTLSESHNPDRVTLTLHCDNIGHVMFETDDKQAINSSMNDKADDKRTTNDNVDDKAEGLAHHKPRDMSINSFQKGR